MSQIQRRLKIAGLIVLIVLSFVGALALAVLMLSALWLNSVLAVVTNGATMVPALNIILAGVGAIALGVIGMLATKELTRRTFGLPAAL